MIAAVGDAAIGTPPVGLFVVGVPGSEGCAGSTGGTAALLHPQGCTDAGPPYCHIDLSASGTDFGAELQAALGQIGNAMASCTYAIPQFPPGYVVLPPDLHVNYNGTELPHQLDAPAVCASGWQLSADQNQIILCGATCATVQADNQASIRVWIGCSQPD